MPFPGITQPEIITIHDALRLHKYTDDCLFALEWYQDEETLLLVDGISVPYDCDKLYRMYHYLENRGEVYFIEVKSTDSSAWLPIGDVTFWQDDMPIVIGDKRYRNQGIGKKVIATLIARAKQLGFSYLEVSDIYTYNAGSRKLFEGAGFRAVRETKKGHTFRLELK